jgi:nitrogen fixation protein NifM
MSSPDKTAVPTYPYTLLKTALILFKKTPDALAEDERSQVERQARNEFKIESRILNTPEAAAVIITDASLQKAYDEIRKQYPDEQTFLQDLQKNNLSVENLRAALHRQCKVNVIMELIGSRVPNISDIEIGIYYHLHPEQFQRPETREACHIFISINADYPENTRERAFERIQALQAKLHKKPYKFTELALKHSECPTALQNGSLGTVPRGKLYPELDAALFNLKAGEISEVLESEIGFHVLLCKAIHPAETLSLQKATPKIRERMQTRAQRICQRAWIASLPQGVTIQETTESSAKPLNPPEAHATGSAPSTETEGKPS